MSVLFIKKTNKQTNKTKRRKNRRGHYLKVSHYFCNFQWAKYDQNSKTGGIRKKLNFLLGKPQVNSTKK